MQGDTYMKKALNIVKSILVWAICIFTVMIMIFTVISVTTFDRNDRSIFGYKAFIVLSDSMAATDFSAGDVVLVKEVDPTTLEVGDIICFSSADPDNYGETVTHKIRALTVDKDGNPAFITYGTSTDTDDKTPVTYPFIKGQYFGRIPYAGTFFRFLKTTPGYICCILVPFMLLILSQAVNSIKLFRAYKDEQSEAIEAERAKLAAEREESMEMLKELQALKAQLAAMKGDGESKPEE